MTNGFDDFKYLLVATCEIPNFIIAMPIKSKTAWGTAGSLVQREPLAPQNIWLDIKIQHSQKLLSLFFKASISNWKIIRPSNDDSLRRERQFQTIRKIITKYTTGNGETWPLYKAVVAYAINTFTSPVLSGL